MYLKQKSLDFHELVLRFFCVCVNAQIFADNFGLNFSPLVQVILVES